MRENEKAMAKGAGVKNRGPKPGRAGRGLAAPAVAVPSKDLAAGPASPCEAMGGAMAGRSVRAVFSASAADVGGGVSNTPSSSLSAGVSTNVVSKAVSPVRIVNTCVDYLSVTFSGHFDPDSTLFDELLRCVLVRREVVEESKGRRNYFHALVLDDEFSVFYGSTTTKDAMGNETWCFEMKGSACRRFEDRVIAEFPGASGPERAWRLQMAWDAFVQWIMRHEGRCSRIDLPTDDESGIVPFSGLKDRFFMMIDKGVRCYVSDLRSFHPDLSYPQADDGENRLCPKGNPRRGDGLSFYLGSGDRIQLCIYNKKAEREAKGFQVTVPSWIRYEVRYMHGHADSAFRMLAAAFRENGNPADFIFSCLSGLFAPLDHPVSSSNASRAEVWAPWVRFVEGRDVVRVFARERAPSTVKTNRDWTIRDASKSLARMAACDPGKLLDIVRYVVNSGLSKLDKKDLQIVNGELVQRHLPSYESVAEMVSAVGYGSPSIDVLGDVDPAIAALFMEEVHRLGKGSYMDDSHGLSDDEVVGGKAVVPFKKGGD